MKYEEISKISVISSSPQFDLRIGVSISSGGKDTSYSKHYDMHKIYYVCDGEATLETENGSFKLKKGVLGFVGYNKMSRIVNMSENFKRVVISVFKINKNSDMIFDLIDKEISQKNIYPLTENFKNCIEYIIDYMENEYANYITAIEYMMIPLLYEFFNIAKLEFNFAYKNIQNESNDKTAKVRKYIEKNISRKITAQEIADYMNLSLRQLNRILNASQGWSVKYQIDAIKYNMAKQLLINTKLNLIEISSKLGFANEHSFITFFKRISGVTPKQYREHYTECGFNLKLKDIQRLKN